MASLHPRRRTTSRPRSLLVHGPAARWEPPRSLGSRPERTPERSHLVSGMRPGCFLELSKQENRNLEKPVTYPKPPDYCIDPPGTACTVWGSCLSRGAGSLGLQPGFGGTGAAVSFPSQERPSAPTAGPCHSPGGRRACGALVI